MSEIKEEDLKASEFISRYTKELNGKPYIDAVNALIEMYARLMTIQNTLKDVHAALGDYGQFAIDLDNRMKELEGKKTIEIISADQAKMILK